jgi:hypothetical protein
MVVFEDDPSKLTKLTSVFSNLLNFVLPDTVLRQTEKHVGVLPHQAHNFTDDMKLDGEVVLEIVTFPIHHSRPDHSKH